MVSLRKLIRNSISSATAGMEWILVFSIILVSRA
jgi:hypothetical protein